MVNRKTLMTFLNEFMGFHDKVPQIDKYLVNGLQVAGASEINKIVTGVSANMQLFEKAVASNAQAILVHHSMNPPNSVYLESDRIFTRRLRYLWEHNLSLIGYHYLLDHHPQVGHNAAIIEALGGTLVEPYAKDGWGWVGEIEGGAPLETVMQTCRDLFDNNGIYFPFGAKTVKRIVALVGAGAPYPSDYEALMRDEVDLFITGEPREWNQELCREAGISFVAGGHYNTEKIGIHKLSEVIQAKFEVEIEFIDVPNQI